MPKEVINNMGKNEVVEVKERRGIKNLAAHRTLGKGKCTVCGKEDVPYRYLDNFYCRDHMNELYNKERDEHGDQ